MNSFGRRFRVTIFGESHGEAIGVVLDGVPAGVALTQGDFEVDLQRRRAGAVGTTSRTEADRPQVVSGVLQGRTTGAPLAILFRNENTRSEDYKAFVDQPRPGHADWVAGVKWDGHNDPRGGGHFSGRLTLGLVAAGVVAKKVLGDEIKIGAKIIEIGGQSDPGQFEAVVGRAVEEQDSVGGVVECRVEGAIPVGWGEPFFDGAESMLAHALFAIPAIKGVEFGAGFGSAAMRGSQHNDSIVEGSGKTRTNHAGGLNGGLTNGNPIVLRVAVKPTSSIGREQQTYNFRTGQVEPLTVQGRHDACIALRVPPVVEAVVALTLCELMLIGRE